MTQGPFILAHRGNTRGPAGHEQENTIPLLAAALEQGYGLELDLRADGERLVISHDPASWTPERCGARLLELLERFPEAPVAWNVKEEKGLLLFLACVSGRRNANDFLFDFELVFEPQDAARLSAQAAAVLPVAVRCSEREELGLAEGPVWLDSFDGTHVTGERVKQLSGSGRRVFCVSRDLHVQSTSPQEMRADWADWARAGAAGICTDYADALAQVIGARP